MENQDYDPNICLAYQKKQYSGFFKNNYSSITPLTKEVFNECYSTFVKEFYEIYQHWGSMTYYTLDAIMPWLYDNLTYLMQHYNELYVENDTKKKPDEIMKDFNVLLEKFKAYEAECNQDECNEEEEEEQEEEDLPE
jgi:hypothetical protein